MVEESPINRREIVRPVLAIITPNLDAYSETFIRAHIERLPARTVVFYGGNRPTYYGDGQRISSPSVFRRAIKYVVRKVQRRSWDEDQDREIAHVLKRLGVRAVLAEYGPTGAAMTRACACARIPLIVHFHGIDAYHKEILQIEEKRYQEMFKYAKAIIAVSRAMEKQLLNLGAPVEKMFYNPYGVDLTLFAGANPAQSPPTFLAVGRFVDKKAPDLTLCAFSRVLEKVPEARLEMIGDGPLWEACKRLAKAFGISDRVSFLGARSHAEVAQKMQLARAFVQHSLTAPSGDSEGLPVAVLEAQASGLPVVSTYHTGIPEAVLDGITGLLVEEGDVDGMAKAMTRLAQNPVLAKSMGEAGRKRVQDFFSMDKSIAGLWAIIAQSLGNERSSL